MGEASTGQRAYIGSFTEAGGAGITVAAVDVGTGALRPSRHLTEVTNPSYLALAPGSGVLYAVSETPAGAVAAYALGDRDRLELIAPGLVPVGGDNPTHLTVAGGQLFTANYGSGSVSALPLRLDGGLVEGAARVLSHQGSGPIADRQRAPHAHAVLPDPQRRWLLSADLGTDAVWIYRLEHTGTALSPHGTARLAGGTGPRHLAFHPQGDRAYVVGELNSTLTSCRWDAERGALEPVTSVSTRAGGGAGENYPSAVVLSTDGRFAWVANRGEDSIAVFALEEDAPGMRLLGTVPCGGHWPRDLAIGPTGRHLYAMNERSGEVVWFDLDPATGLPTRAGHTRVPAASCLVFG